jgi:hypothetical protein
MLKAYHGEFNKENAYQLTSHSRDELHTLIDRLAAARTVSSYGGGSSGHHAWIIVSDHGFNLEIYFGEDTHKDGVISFVLYGPCAPGEWGDIYDGRGLHGGGHDHRVSEGNAGLDGRGTFACGVCPRIGPGSVCGHGQAPFLAMQQTAGVYFLFLPTAHSAPAAVELGR